jgi:hypothetical protein
MIRSTNPIEKSQLRVEPYGLPCKGQQVGQRCLLHLGDVTRIVFELQQL